MPASNHLGNAILEASLRGGAWPAPARVFVSLHTGDPGNDGANEVTAEQWPSYARKDPAGGDVVTSGFAAANAKSTTNAKEILWAEDMDGPAQITVSHFAIWDAQANGNCLFVGSLYAAKTLAPTDECVVHVGDLAVTVN